jgi:methyl-CpG-binding domain protein 4
MRSPYNLLQEIYREDPWKVMVCCILLNQTTRKQVDKIRKELFETWPDSLAMSQANQESLSDLIRPLGFYNRRAKTLIRFSTEWNERAWENPIELHGIGEYGQDSWKIFIQGQIVEDPSDHVLKDYIKWKKQN